MAVPARIAQNDAIGYNTCSSGDHAAGSKPAQEIIMAKGISHKKEAKKPKKAKA